MELYFEDFFNKVVQFEQFPVVLFTSIDDFDIQQSLDAIRNAGASLDRIPCDHINQELLTESLFTEKKHIFLITDIDGLEKKHFSCIERYIANRTTCGIILAGESAQDTLDFVRKHGLVVRAPVQKPWELQQSVEKWILAYLGKQNLRIDAQAAVFLAKEFSCNRSLIKQELDKLALYCETKTVTLHDVLQLVVSPSKRPLYELHDALLQRDKKQVAMILSSLCNEGVHPLQITRYLRNQMRQNLLKEGLSPKRSKLAEQAGDTFLMSCLMAIDTVEVQLKNQTQDEALTLERTLLRL